MKTKYIVFTADVQSVQAAKLRGVITQAINERYEELYFLISSSGGNVAEGLSLAAYIKALPMKTTMHNIGQVDSVATVIFSAGKTRISGQNASFMFHGVSMSLEKTSLLEQQLKELYESSKRMKSDIAKAISVYTGLPLVDIETLMVDGGTILSANSAKEKGFVTDILEPQIPNGADIVAVSNA